MTLELVEHIELPSHRKAGEFDHAAVDSTHSRLYLAHTANDSVQVVDLERRRWVRTLPGLRGVAGVWVAPAGNLLFTSNRGEDTCSVFSLPGEREMFRLRSGHRPNGMAFDEGRQLLLVAGVGDAKAGAAPTATFFDATTGKQLSQIPLPGRTRWATYVPEADAFYVNIADPPQVAEIPAADPSGVRRSLPVDAVGPHGLEREPDGRTLYCACDDGRLLAIELPSGRVRNAGSLAGSPDVLWLNPRRHHLYVAIGDPGVVQVFATDPLTLVATVPTGKGAHTLAFDPGREEVHVLVPETHEDLVFRDGRER